MAGNGKPTHNYTSTNFLNQATANQIKTVTIAPNGHATGDQANGDKFTTQIPTAVRDDQLLPLLKDHKVQIKATASNGVSILSII